MSGMRCARSTRWVPRPPPVRLSGSDCRNDPRDSGQSHLTNHPTGSRWSLIFCFFNYLKKRIRPASTAPLSLYEDPGSDLVSSLAGTENPQRLQVLGAVQCSLELNWGRPSFLVHPFLLQLLSGSLVLRGTRIAVQWSRLLGTSKPMNIIPDTTLGPQAVLRFQISQISYNLNLGTPIQVMSNSRL